MASGLLALLDDVAAIAKVAAASIDDVGSMAIKAGAKSAGVVIDDAAVTPRYVVGFSAKRELPIIWAITKGSLRNKLLVLLPGALLLGFFAPWAITPLLMFGGLFLCFEGAEKVVETVWHKGHHDGAHGGTTATNPPGTPADLEKARVASAIKTDFILSAEIMALTLSSVPEAGFLQQAAVLAIVAVGITALVYGAVAVIVKADDVGVAMADRDGTLIPALGRGIVRAMPGLLKALTAIGMVAMLMVGGGILLHGLEVLGVPLPQHLVHNIAHLVAGIPSVGVALEWIVNAALTMVIGFVIGVVLIPIVTKVVIPFVRLFTRRKADGDA
ncbi:DUF808 domain-containing protein [Meridianimarinicoccus aquatilis]|uniref:DUF808 domain-containing protein n=1 Tax=Meridianimarinicoccus aquatilis TaxID=2552766 RepID=A0A4R6ASK9_9RHOB|nr:DUF808 domain-containing protein [Fluviibacterium aquatile]TDL85126.1 DUF808 domain-containing protein [Fluviibacterium aquatile]